MANGRPASKKPSEILNSEFNSYKTNEHKSDLEAALGASSSADSFYFPSNIVEVDHWMAIRVIDRQYTTLRQVNDYTTDKDIARIFLPLPLNLATAYNQTYNAEALGPIGNVLANKGSEMRSTVEKLGTETGNFIAGAINLDFGKVIDAGVKATKTIGNALYNALPKTGKQGERVVQGAAAYGVYSLAGAAGATPYGQGALGGAGLARNPYMAVLYSQPEFRMHEFSWKVVAKDFEESVSILNIIKLLKYYSAPSEISSQTAGGVLQFFYDYPEQFDIEFHHDKFLFNIGPSVLKNVSVNYHAEGQPLYFTKQDSVVDDNDTTYKVPVSIQIGLSFQEVTTLTKQSILNSNR